MPTVIANRYARALADVVASTGNYRQVLGELEDFGAAYRESVELRVVCETPALALVRKLGVLAAVAQRLGTSPVTLNFLRVLLSHYRLTLLGEVTQSFRNVSYGRLGIVRVKISSASRTRSGSSCGHGLASSCASSRNWNSILTAT
jgi:F-type H+-transporting ATPase subunit delta